MLAYRYEIAEMEKIPTTLPNFDDVMTAFTADLPLVKKHDTFPALSTYQYSKAKMREDVDYTGRNELLTQDTDVSKKNMEEPWLFEVLVCFCDCMFIYLFVFVIVFLWLSDTILCAGSPIIFMPDQG